MLKDWTHIQEKYEGQWVALADDEETVVGHGASIREARELALKKGHNDPIFARMPERGMIYVGNL